MVETTESTRATEDLHDALEAALASGLPHGEIVSMVANAMKDAEETELLGEPKLPGFEPENLPVYVELPEGMIDLPTAAKRYERNVRTIYNWVRRGHLEVKGRLKAPTWGGGYIVVSEKDLVNHLATPRNKGGRPIKT